MKVLFIGDIFGKPGREILIDYLPNIKKEFDIDFCIANGENVAHGRGITEKTSKSLFKAGVDLFTSGNHLWDQRDAMSFLDWEHRILKPANYPKKAFGSEYLIINNDQGNSLGVFNLSGQAFMGSANSFFETADYLINIISKETDSILVDFHAEATAEKRALGHYLDGRISAIVGTHTHIQTADEEILSNGTAYITDVGMTGPHDSVIGVKKEIILKKMSTGMPIKYEIASTGIQINAVVIEIDDHTGDAISIERLKREYSDD